MTLAASMASSTCSKRRLGDDVIRLLAAQQPDAAGVHQRERLSVPLGLGADAVARDARLVMHDGDAPPDDAVEQGRLADIRAGQQWQLIQA